MPLSARYVLAAPAPEARTAVEVGEAEREVVAGNEDPERGSLSPCEVVPE